MSKAEQIAFLLQSLHNNLTPVNAEAFVAELQRQMEGATAEEIHGKLLFFNDRWFTVEELEKVLEWYYSIQFTPLEDFLNEKHLTAIERLRHYETAEELGEGCRLITEQPLRTYSAIFGLEFSLEQFHRGIDRKTLAEKMQKLGDRIWEALKPTEETNGSE